MREADVPGALARLWSAYPAAGKARSELRLVFSLLGDNPPEEDQPVLATESWRVGHSEENFLGGYEFASREEAIAFGREEFDGDSFWVGESELYRPKLAHSMIDRLLECLSEDAHDEGAGEYVGDWPSPTAAKYQDLERRLDEAIHGWLEAHPPSWFMVGVSERIPSEAE